MTPEIGVNCIHISDRRITTRRLFEVGMRLSSETFNCFSGSYLGR